MTRLLDLEEEKGHHHCRKPRCIPCCTLCHDRCSPGYCAYAVSERSTGQGRGSHAVNPRSKACIKSFVPPFTATIVVPPTSPLLLFWIYRAPCFPHRNLLILCSCFKRHRCFRVPAFHRYLCRNLPQQTDARSFFSFLNHKKDCDVIH